MKPYYQQDKWAIYYGDCREILPQLDKASAIVTDPPYELGFMGKSWDSKGISFQKEIWGIIRNSCLPGAMLLSFGGTRTFHRIAVAIEDAGWVYRDTAMWVYGSGFPKSLDISKAIDKHGGKQVGWFGQWLRDWRIGNHINQKEIAALFPSKTGGLTGCVANWELGFNMPTPEQFNLICQKFNLPFESIEQAEREIVGKGKSHVSGEGENNSWNSGYKLNYNITAPTTPEAELWEGYGTALKPAYEPIILAMNPLDGTFANNALKHGVAGLNIDECRIAYEKGGDIASNPLKRVNEGHTLKCNDWLGDKSTTKDKADIISQLGRFPANFIHDGSQMVMELFPNTKSGNLNIGHKRGKTEFYGGGIIQNNYGGDNGSAARFFYCAKASKAERNKGCENMVEQERKRYGDMPTQGPLPQQTPRRNLPEHNNHPTVKPLALMTYLVKLVKMPEYNSIRDPFMGSGTTLLACIKLGIPCIGIDNDEKSCEIAAKRCCQEVMELV